MFSKYVRRFSRYFSTDAKPYKEIPSPSSLPFLGHIALFFPNGPYSTDDLTSAVIDLSEKYGSMFRLKFFNREFVICTNADQFAEYFTSEGKYPVRFGTEGLATYHDDKFGMRGVITGAGETWFRLRRAISPLLKKSFISKYNDVQNDISRDFVAYVKRRRDENFVLKDVWTHLIRFNIESISIISPGRRIRCLSESENEDTRMIVNSGKMILEGNYGMMKELPVWKFYKTASYKKLAAGHDGLTELVARKMRDAEESCTDDSLVNFLMKNSDLNEKEISLVASEIFLSGIESASTTLGMILFYLAREPRMQESARRDPSYLKLCLKETTRLAAIAGSTSRTCTQDTILGGYAIPKNTNLLLFHSAAVLNEKYFENAKEFKPERWVRGVVKHHPYVNLPFGHGTRMCPGKFLIEQLMLTLLTHILQSFELKPVTTEVAFIYRTSRVPDRPIHVKFVDRN